MNSLLIAPLLLMNSLLIAPVFKLHERPRGGGYLRLRHQVPGSGQGAPSAAAAAFRPLEDVPDGLAKVVEGHVAAGLLPGRAEAVFQTLSFRVREGELSD